MSSGRDDDDPIEQLRRKMAKALKGFEGGLPEGSDPWSLRGGRPDSKLFPVPELVLFALRDVMGFRWSGLGEKVRWSVYATVENEPFVFEMRKFGFAIDHRDDVPPALIRRVEGQLSSSLRLLEPLLAAYAKAQIADGNLTLANRMSEFDDRYGYFRSQADAAFRPAAEEAVAGPSEEGPPGKTTVFADLSARMSRNLQREQEGYFASGAMVDAYFSRLEHRVLLLRAFVGRALAKGGFEAFLKMTWDERLREIGDLDAHPAHRRILGRMRKVKATIRNPLAHGGVENDGGAFHFHMPNIGAIPANLSRYRGRLRMSFFPIAEATRDGSHRVTSSSFEALTARLVTFAAPGAPGWMKLPIVVRMIGGRSKPWGPIVEGLLEGRLRYAVTPGPQPLLRRIVIDPADARRLAEMVYVPPGDAVFLPMMSKNDALEVLNLHARHAGAALKHWPSAKTSDRTVPVAEVLELSRRLVSLGELVARTGRPVKSVVAMLTENGVPVDAPWSPRDEAEAALFGGRTVGSDRTRREGVPSTERSKRAARGALYGDGSSTPAASRAKENVASVGEPSGSEC